MPTILKILGLVLMVIATVSLGLVGLAAAKGFLTIRYGLIVDLPMAILGMVMFVAGKKTPRKDLSAPSQQVRRRVPAAESYVLAVRW